MPCQGNLLTQAAGATKLKTSWLGHGQSQNVFTIISSRVVLTRGPLYSSEVVLAISGTGTSKYVVKALELAKQKGMKSIAVTAYQYSPVSRIADLLLLSPPRGSGTTLCSASPVSAK